jgi:hypothetical protein
MTAGNVNVRLDISSGIVAHDATNRVLLFALNRIPVSTHRLLCHWHRNSDVGSPAAGSLSPDPASSIRNNLWNGS